MDLLENEFFGHEPGAFTSATASHRGLLQEANGGALFLDEVDCLSAAAQVKLLRFIQDGEFRPLGSEKIHNSDVRIIAASNADIFGAIASGRFRADLYYRLCVASFTLPPLRERGDDLILLARHFLAKYRHKFGAGALEFSPAAIHKMLSHHWPGNVRELENVIQGAIIQAGNGIIEASDITIAGLSTEDKELGFQALKAKAIEQFEKTYLRRLLLVHNGNITKAANAAGKNRRAFWELMRKHQIGAQRMDNEALAPGHIDSLAGQTVSNEKSRHSHSESRVRPDCPGCLCPIENGSRAANQQVLPLA